MSGLNQVTATMRIAVAGASGRMGHMLLEAVNASEEIKKTATPPT